MTVVAGEAHWAADEAASTAARHPRHPRPPGRGLRQAVPLLRQLLEQRARTIVVDTVKVTVPGMSVVGSDSNLGDRATLTRNPLPLRGSDIAQR